MTDRTPAVLITANGAGWKAVAADTLLSSVGLRDYRLPERLARYRTIRLIAGRRYEALSYVMDWGNAFLQSPRLQAVEFNINDVTRHGRLRKAVRSAPLVIILHSAAGDSMSMLQHLVSAFQERSGKLVMFIGNEYDLMDEKIAFIKATDADYVCTQLPIEAGRWVYSECKNSTLLAMPHALNSEFYSPPPAGASRATDVGFIGALYSVFIGDDERTQIIDYFLRNGASRYGLRTDIRTGNVQRAEWAAFLRACHGIIGAESGTYYLDRGTLLSKAKEYVRRNPGATLADVRSRFFDNPGEHVSGKAISSRHFEPIGTKTCQILLEGHYNGILRPEEHYISVRKDLSDVGEAIERFKDVSYRERIADHAYDYVMSRHTYAHRVDELLDAVLQSSDRKRAVRDSRNADAANA